MDKILLESGFALLQESGDDLLLEQMSVVVSGVQGVLFLGGVLVWGDVIDAQTPNWQNVPVVGGALWGDVIDAQTPNWQEVAA
jgi:hypothetical protein